MCADWCGVCREYRAGFEEVSRHFADARFEWLDIEEQADDLGDIEVENFPTLLIRRRESILFFGAMPPAPAHLERTLRTFQRQTVDESHEYAASSPERRSWQVNEDLRRIGSRGAAR
ncbi:thioredoxin family protein [Accumulibacter sp.]|uniref:thioredoxin family protein n=1 Tax=Accumulibacter sp. TaxID=2053492 RepID=UPI0025D89998|nr:thioredoxin family protein [Accumulibacter sp.]MCM8593845.1 thioredoxin family protein [Accumulibacter sp.]MCM8626113.1 thioredoxin family protein [Accumulibacter sp.]MDS4047986.1 thioredoxin family protein [Accumulibacter sp.]